MNEYICEYVDLLVDKKTLNGGVDVLTSKESVVKKESVVRCRDCDYSNESESGALYCNGYLTEPWDYYNDEPSLGRKVTLDGFCAWGERKQ